MRILFALIVTLFLAVPPAQAQDSVFSDYDDYATFVDTHVMGRDFVPLILRLGGRDEYTDQELAENDKTLRNVWPLDFTHVTTFRREDLGGGVSQEGRMYWNGTSYAFFYALLHERSDGFVVISFHLNTSSKKVMERF